MIFRIPGRKKGIQAEFLTGGAAKSCCFRSGDGRKPRFLLVVGLLLVCACLAGCGENSRHQIKASFKSGGTIIQVTNNGDWEWTNVLIKINRYTKDGPYFLRIKKSLSQDQSVNLALLSFKNKFGINFNPAKNKVETVSLVVNGGERTFRFTE